VFNQVLYKLLGVVVGAIIQKMFALDSNHAKYFDLVYGHVFKFVLYFFIAVLWHVLNQNGHVWQLLNDVDEDRVKG
jgi:hypothetical protein